MPADTIALAADHAGYELKNLLKEEIARRGLAVLDEHGRPMTALPRAFDHFAAGAR